MNSTSTTVPCCVGATILNRRIPRWKTKPPRAALVEKSKPVPARGGGGGGGDNAASIVLRVRDDSSTSGALARDRADDMQAEARAMARAVDASVYSPENLIRIYGSRPIKLVGRTVEIFAGVGAFALNLWLDRVNGGLDRNQRLRAIELRKTFTSLGPTFVKIGQGLSTRPDLCPPIYLAELSQLQDALRNFHMQKLFLVLRKSWDVRLILFTHQYLHLQLRLPV